MVHLLLLKKILLNTRSSVEHGEIMPKGNAVITGGNFIVDENAAESCDIGFGEGSSTGGSLTVEGGSFDGSFGNQLYIQWL